jgi:diguanylate cyclase (GGDEF)-like protein/PAS domain S-box-containing protein
MRRAVESSPDAMAVLSAMTDQHGTVVDFRFDVYNTAAAGLIGHSADEVIGRTVTELFPDAAKHLVELWRQTLELGEPRLEEVETAAGRRWLRQSLVPMGDALLVSSHDISDRKRAEAELEHRAFHDPLTDLPNRVLATQRIGESLVRTARTGRHTAVLFVDLDRFKSVNDTLGHAAGDLLLQALANRLRHSVRGQDTVARLSGDEFVVCLDDVTGESDAVLVVEKLAVNLRKPFAIGDRKVVLTGSIGMALSTDGVDADTLISRADAAAYEAKRRGRNRYAIFDEAIRQRVVQELTVEQELRTGIALGELRLHFQPTLDLSKGTVTGVEALVRWEHPERGLLGPAEFLGVAEHSGMMGDLGRWVRAAACGAMARMLHDHRTPEGLVMWVNVAAAELTTSFCDDLVSALALADVPADRFGVELTETALASDIATTELVLDRLVSMGVHIAIDDFGAGSSSLAYLQRLRAEVMKVHPSFVHGLDHDSDDNARGAAEIAAALLSFGQRLGMTVVAEGVESSEQLEALTALGCTAVTGNLVCPALDEDRILEQFEVLAPGRPA